ncbi:MAG: IS3 family transposase, partial [Tenacibaculum sp.]
MINFIFESTQQQEGYQVNHKKVYRLMKENQLLHPKR